MLIKELLLLFLIVLSLDELLAFLPTFVLDFLIILVLRFFFQAGALPELLKHVLHNLNNDTDNTNCHHNCQHDNDEETKLLIFSIWLIRVDDS